jgi:hypothetical protein
MQIERATIVCLITSFSVGESGPVVYFLVAACLMLNIGGEKQEGRSSDEKAGKPKYAAL